MRAKNASAFEFQICLLPAAPRACAAAAAPSRITHHAHITSQKTPNAFAFFITHSLINCIRRWVSQKTFPKLLSVVRHRIKTLSVDTGPACSRIPHHVSPQRPYSLTLTLRPNPIPYAWLRRLRRSAFRPLRGRSARFAGGLDFLLYPLCFCEFFLL